MKVRSFLDTNIIVYAFGRGLPEKARIAQQLITDGVSERQAVISYQVVQEFINVVLYGFRVAMSTLDLESFVLTALFPMMAVSSSRALLLQALRLQAAHQLAWHDSLVVAAALESNCMILYSEDLQDGRRFGDVVVKNPFV